MEKIIPDKRLFWFLKEGIRLDLREPAVLNMYIQQVITHGTTSDVRALLKMLNLNQLQESFKQIGHFIPQEVRRFWEDFIGDTK